MLTQISMRGERAPARRRGPCGLGRQAGMTLIEAMIALGLSLFVTTAMVVLMANSLGTASRVIQMTQLTDELRNAMSMMSRDVRRANYNAHAAYCYANSDCGIDGSANQSPDVVIDNGDCMIFNLDRNQDGDASTDEPGAFRRVVSGVGVIEMWVGDAVPDCNAPTARDCNDPDPAVCPWVEVTDPAFVDVTLFNIDDSESFVQTFPNEDGTSVTQRTRQLQLQIEGRLVRENTITRRIDDVIKLRNDVISKT